MIEVGLVSGDVAASIIDSELFDRISTGNSSESDIRRCFSDSDIHIGAAVSGSLIGVITFIPESSTTVEVHCNFLKQHREAALEASRLIAEAFLSEYPTVQKLRASIPDIYPDVIGFALKFGFVKEGIDRKSICKSGKMIDRIYMGVTRQELELKLWAQ